MALSPVWCLKFKTEICTPFWGIRLWVDSPLASISACPSQAESLADLLHTVYSGISEQIKPLQLVGQAALADSWQSSSLSPSSSPCWSSGKAVPEDVRSFWLQNQWPSSLGRAQALLRRVGRASADTGRFWLKFWVSCILCWPRLARLRKRCYHS